MQTKKERYDSTTRVVIGSAATPVEGEPNPDDVLVIKQACGSALRTGSNGVNV
jgi:hypothetical protein